MGYALLGELEGGHGNQNEQDPKDDKLRQPLRSRDRA